MSCNILNMNSEQALKKCIELVGMKPLALNLGVSYQAIQRYMAAGQIVSDRVLTCAQATNWQVTPHQLRPDLYPHPQDGLPKELRAA